ncbi:hypothetical protein GRS48_14720 [Halorubrum sp. JWXQ-INN 858]|uniref:DUF7346 family protein n=1 Tax=Halorubrum sp. JWXQ-INN 858 TaxID=2690782 RepID=UPI00135CCD8D|nr:hypothetical protein [Halorubrum sp. JWXQ-INN 858]MWV66063.1 hypothetical protein [Halorubrum sp. JWXQ-INN 858]
MQTVRDADGTALLLVKRSGESSRVRDPATGEERYVDNATLTVVDDESPLSTAASGVPAPVRRVMGAVHDDRTLGLLVELVDHGPLSVLEAMDAYDMCESDLHGRLAEFRAAGLIDEADVAGRRGYEATAIASAAVRLLRGETDGPT